MAQAPATGGASWSLLSLTQGCGVSFRFANTQTQIRVGEGGTDKCLA